MKIVYNSFQGRYSDNPRAIYEALLQRGDGIEHVWLTSPLYEATFPAGIAAAPIDSDEARRALESADLVVSNTHIEQDWDKSPGTVYLQTWHGTPLKHIHYDSLFVPPGVLDRLDRDVARWDALLSPNVASTERLRKAFAFEGEVLEVGYPRNDVLNGPDRDRRRAAVRRDLGIADDKAVVLYAPTWRDDHDRSAEFEVQLDVDELTRRLGPDHVLVLRLHYFDSARLGPLDGEHVKNESMRPDISDLYLAADVLVTDYSSVMFDFAVTGKPILFFTYDLDHYRDTLRGFYFDFLAHAPGPLLASSDDVIDALSDLAPVTANYREAYAAFRDQYCHLEDGLATQRVLDRFVPGGAT